MEIFISHSQQDRNVAIEFKKMFEDFGKYWMPETADKVSVFLSSKLSNDQRQTAQWKKNFESHLGDSSVVVILVTPKSINSRWVQYETGYAMAQNKKIIQIGIRGVSPEKILLREDYIHIVKTKEDLQDICTTIFKVPKRLAEGWCLVNSENMTKLINLCNERCVYFVGSNPTNDTNKKEWKQEFVSDFLRRLTELILKKGSKVSSFPTVNEVGAHVYYAAKDCDTPESHTLELYEISGLYNFDQQPETERGDKIDAKTWKKYLRSFREHYLENKDSMIIIGGKEHTKEECEVAEKLGYIEIFPIPCMGGFAKEKYEEMSKDNYRWEKYNHPCRKCYESGAYKNIEKCSQASIDLFAERLEQYRYINEDERES